MAELWELMLLSYNLPLTILLGAVFLYWIVSLLGGLDFDFLDGLMDAGEDSADGRGGDDHHDGVFQSAMRFLNATDVPVMVVLSFLVLFLWATCLLGNYFFNPGHSDVLGALIAIPALIASLLLVKVVTKPLAPAFRKLRGHTPAMRATTGREGSVRSKELDDRSGQVELDGDDSILLNARIPEGHAPLPRGARVLVVGEQDEKGRYLVRELASGMASPESITEQKTEKKEIE
jgi:hypothetical protein